MAILVDTSAYSAALRGNRGVQEILRANDDVRVNAIIVGELRAGFARGQHVRRNETLLSSFLSKPSVMIHVVDPETADCYVAISNTLFAAGTPIGTNDIWIAATAMQHGLRLVTLDRDFLRVAQIRADVLDP